MKKSMRPIHPVEILREAQACGTFELEERDVRIIGITWLCRKVPGGKWVMK
jgi:hypothetical protein